ncbi:MAG: InlB B-repeat-containing protein [Dysgonamonadaceae bacterium]|jgi:rhamnogalacturonan endolyase|nr:InlB B-repeat-containing protein [Dysgonamonadaceae bacterium]
MKTNFLHFFRCLSLTAAALFISMATQAQTWDVSTDFESNSVPFDEPTGYGSRSINTLGGETGYSLYMTANGSGSRAATFNLTAPVEGSVLDFEFDWYAGPLTTATNRGVFSIQDAKGTGNQIFSIRWNISSGSTYRFAYLTGNYTNSATDLETGTVISGITAVSKWYTLKIRFDFQQKLYSFTITDKATPTNTQTYSNIPLSTANPPNPKVGSFYFNGIRASGQTLNITSAIDNFKYKVVDATPPGNPITGITLDGLDKVAPGSTIMLYPRVTPTNADDKTVTWTSDNTSVATVDADKPIVTGVSEGTAVIRATSNDVPTIYAEKTITVAPLDLPKRNTEKLDRGLVAVKTGTGVFLTWRLLGSDPDGIQFNLYKNGGATPVNGSPLNAAYTDYTDASGTLTDTYTVAVLFDGEEAYRSKSASVWDEQYLEIPVQKPTTGHLYNGSAYNDYTIYDGTVADLDGDGQYEIVFFWAPANLQDNSTGGYTGNVFIDAYKLDGTKLWGAGKYIDLGSNIRAGAHYTMFLVADFDGDGKAEIIVKTAPGTTDTQGTMIGSSTYLGNSSGYILSGPEYLSVFEGATGTLLDTKDYNPPRGTVSAWGDDYGNRVDRFLVGLAYLDGVHPSAVMCRGYYTRTCLAAWDWNGTALTQRWFFDSNVAGSQYAGQGNHNLSVADVDADGKDEIIYGSLTLDDDGTAMYTTGLGHGDAIHVGKLDPTRPGLQVVDVHEETPFGIEMHDAMTGDIIWRVTGTTDTGRGVSADVDPSYPGEESWSAGGLGTFAADGTKLGGSISVMNMVIYWDGDTGRELFDGTDNPVITKITASGTAPNKTFATATPMTFSGASTNGGTKANPCLQADILGDWREEVILRKTDNTALRIYTTINPTTHTGAGAVPASGIPTLMHNKEYRNAIAWQNAGYNQPPHVDFFLGYNMSDVVREEGRIFTITLVPNGGVFEDASTGTKLIKMVTDAYFDVPGITKSASEFLGWFKSDDTAFDPITLEDSDITLYAKWLTTTVYHTVTFEGEGITDIDPQTVEDGQTAEEPTEPVRTGYTFDGWYNGDDLWDFDDPVSDDLTLVAHWTAITYTVTFEGEGVTGIDPQILLEGERVTYPAEPYRSGYIFAGWYSANGAWDFNNPVYADMTLVAHWIAITYTVTFEGEGIEGITMTITEGELIVRPDDPVRRGYRFDGWYYYNELWNFDYPAYSNMTLVAHWTAIPAYTVIFEGENIGNPDSQTVFEGETLVPPNEPPARSGYLFLGWYYNDELWNFYNPVYADMTLVGRWKDITGIAGLDGAELQIYPNPAYDYVVISGLDGNETVYITDIAGRILLIHKATNQKETINLNKLQQGSYLIRIVNEKNAKTTKLIIRK